MSTLFRALSDGVLGLLFPDRCAGCGRNGALLCAACRASIRPYPAHEPPVRGNDALSHLDGASVAYRFEGALRLAIHTLKYNHVRRMAEPLGDMLAQHLQAHPQSVDAIIPVPLHPRRLAERGFNQSELLARRLAQVSGIPLLTVGLARCRDTAHQMELDARARQDNVRDAFVWQHPQAPPARVLLLDDVLTTGATIQACAQALRAAGAQEVRAIALARSQTDPSSKASKDS